MKSMIVASVLSLSAITANAYEATASTVQGTTNNPALLISTSDAITKLAELRLKYECVKAQAKANNAEICKGLDGYSKFLEKVSLEDIAAADEDLTYAIASEGEQITASVDMVVSRGRTAETEFKGFTDMEQLLYLKSLPDMIVDLN